jgi:hypothetical protein
MSGYWLLRITLLHGVSVLVITDTTTLQKFKFENLQVVDICTGETYAQGQETNS